MATLHCGDNMEILRHHLADKSGDLVYLHPAFNTAQNDNACFPQLPLVALTEAM